MPIVNNTSSAHPPCCILLRFCHHARRCCEVAESGSWNRGLGKGVREAWQEFSFQDGQRAGRREKSRSSPVGSRHRWAHRAQASRMLRLHQMIDDWVSVIRWYWAPWRLVLGKSLNDPSPKFGPWSLPVLKRVTLRDSGISLKCNPINMFKRCTVTLDAGISYLISPAAQILGERRSPEHPGVHRTTVSHW